MDDKNCLEIEITIYDGSIVVEKPKAYCLIDGLSVPEEENDHADTSAI